MNKSKPFGQAIINDAKGYPIYAKTQGQLELIRAIDSYDILFVNGPAGTGKSFLGICKAVKALENGDVERIILTRPAVESGEELGFLPGGLDEKIAPFMKPLYDSIVKLKGKKADALLNHPGNGQATQGKTPEAVTKKPSHKGDKRGWKSDEPQEQVTGKDSLLTKIEVSPLAYMRGATFDNSFVIADEAQNITPAQMKLLLTRLGEGSKVIICGDATQTDLDNRVGSGFALAQKILKNVHGIGFITLTEKDIVRHKLVKDIILSYSAYESRNYRREGVESNDNWESEEHYVDENDREELICTNIIPDSGDYDEYDGLDGTDAWRNEE